MELSNTTFISYFLHVPYKPTPTPNLTPKPTPEKYYATTGMIAMPAPTPKSTPKPSPSPNVGHLMGKMVVRKD